MINLYLTNNYVKDDMFTMPIKKYIQSILCSYVKLKENCEVILYAGKVNRMAVYNK